jgi:predicted transcriptional regulator
MKRTLWSALVIAAILVWGLPVIDAADVSTDASADLGATSGPLEVDDDNLTRHVARTAWNATADTRSTGGGSGGDGEAKHVPSMVTGPSRSGSSAIMPSSDEASPVLVAAGTVLGLGALVFYWATVKFWVMTTLLAPLFSRIAKDKILDNTVRSRVFDAIEHNPGVTIKEVTEICGVGWGTAVYHLKRLEDEALVVSQRNRQFRRYFKNGGGIVNGQKTAYAELKNETGQALARAIMENPGSVQQDLCQEVGVSAPVAHKYLARLEKADLVRKEKEWRYVRYFPTSRLGELVAGPLVATA